MTRLKQILGLAGILVAIAGIMLESRSLVWAAMALLGISIMLRVIIRIRARHAESEPPPE